MLFNDLKKKKEEKINQRNFESKMRIKQTLNQMRNQSTKLDTFKKSYIDKAKKACLEGDQSTYNLAKSGLKMCLSKQKYLNQMIAHFELSLEMSNMNNVVTEFMAGINELGKQLQIITGEVDMVKTQMIYEKALANNAYQYESLETFLSEANNSVDGLSNNLPQVSDDEIDKLISNTASDYEEEIDKEIDDRLRNLKERSGLKDE